MVIFGETVSLDVTVGLADVKDFVGPPLLVLTVSESNTRDE
jgi:hypothetical protein